MKYIWEDLPERKNCFTVKNTAMINLNTGKIVQQYATNTRITLVQKCVTPNKTYYRTSEAAYHYLNYAFEASAFGLPDEKAPSAPSAKSNSSLKHSNIKPVILAPKPDEKQKSSQKVVPPKDGEGGRLRSWLSKVFRRNNA